MTPLGLGALAVTVLAFVAGWLSGWEELSYVSAVGAVALILASAFIVGRSDFAVDLSVHPTRVRAGDEPFVELAVRNVGRRRSLPTRMDLELGPRSVPLAVGSLAVDEEVIKKSRIQTRRRSIIRIGPVAAVRTDPLGLLRREHGWDAFVDLYVHPVISELSRLGSGFLRDLEGQSTQTPSPSDIAFHTLRDYVPGDDVRHIHWKTTVRTGELMVRQFVDTRRSLLAALIAAGPAEYANDEEFELIVSVVASVVVRALRDDQTAEFVVGNRVLSARNPTDVLDGCSGVDVGDGSLEATIVQANRVAAEASIIVIGTGSSISVGDVRAMAGMLKSDGHVIILRAVSGSAGEARSTGDVTVIEAADLPTFERLLYQATVS